jgi:RNA polymerase sigma factor (sigma-70 family)
MSDADSAHGRAGVSDAELVPLAAAGDQGAYLHLWNTYRTTALQSAWRHLGDPDAAEDVASEVFLRLRQGRWRVKPGESKHLHAFVRRVTMYACWAWQTAERGQHVQRQYESVEALEELLPTRATYSAEAQTIRAVISTGTVDPETLASQREHAALLADALHSLTAIQRQVAYLRWIEELSLFEVADRLGMSTHMASMRCQQARAKIRAAIGHVYDLPPVSKKRPRGLHVIRRPSNNGSQALVRFNEARAKRRQTEDAA